MVDHPTWPSRRDRGFTAVEVAFVLVLVAAMLAIVLPSWVGARERAWDADARSAIATALRNARGTLDESRGVYGDEVVTVASLVAAEPAFEWFGATTPSTGPDNFSTGAYPSPLGGYEVFVVTRSLSGRCFAVRDDVSFGNWYAWWWETDAPCQAESATVAGIVWRATPDPDSDPVALGPPGDPGGDPVDPGVGAGGTPGGDPGDPGSGSPPGGGDPGGSTTLPGFGMNPGGTPGDPGSGGTLVINPIIAINGNLSVSGNVTVDGGIHTNGNLDFSGSANVGLATATGTLTCSGQECFTPSTSAVVLDPNSTGGAPEYAIQELDPRVLWDTFRWSYPHGTLNYSGSGWSDGAWFDLCPDGTARIPDGAAPCEGTVVVNQPVDANDWVGFDGWRWNPSTLVWDRTLGSGMDPATHGPSPAWQNPPRDIVEAVFYVHEASARLSGNNGGTVTVIAAAGADPRSGNIDSQGHGGPFAPLMGNLLFVAERDLRVGNSFYSVPGASVDLYAGEQVSLSGNVNFDGWVRAVEAGDVSTLVTQSSFANTIVIEPGTVQPMPLPTSPPAPPSTTTTTAATLAIPTGPVAVPFEVTAAVNIDNDWGAGYCATVTLSTASTTQLTWQAFVPVPRAPYSVWNAEWTYDGGVLTADGVGWNDSVVAGQDRSFGFCVNR